MCNAGSASGWSVGCYASTLQNMVNEFCLVAKGVTVKKTSDRWELLLNQGRRKSKAKPEAGKAKQKSVKDFSAEPRTEIERDYDRILFSTPVRRLADKTQVFPLDKNDSVRTRLTHSHEVGNLGRSVGTSLYYCHGIAAGVADSARNLPSVLAAAGLVHDLGNPPFGHQGEVAIQSWFKENEQDILAPLLSSQQKLDFLKFEGNAQGFRLVTRLQLLNDDFGLDLTYATLAAMMKYPTRSDQVDGSSVTSKKHGFFASEQHIAEQVLKATGLAFGQRHAAAYIMEACDDIAYVVLDAEDAVKKGLASFSDLIAFLQHHAKEDEVVERVLVDSREKHKSYRATGFQLSPAELNDISMQRFRVFAIGELVKAATQAFVEKEQELLCGEVAVSLMALSKGEVLRKALKEFSYKHAYTHPSVLKIELEGYNVIRGLMDLFWASIVDRDDPLNPKSDRRHPFSRFVYGRISENYRRVFEHPIKEVSAMPIRYRECQLLTDMLSGMTDSYAINLYDELLSMKGDYDPVAIRAAHRCA